MIGQLLLIFSNLDNDKSQNTILEIYNLEKYLENKFNFNSTDLGQKELNILNNAIMQKKFRKTIIISNIYKKLYNHNSIQKFYKKYIHYKNSKKNINNL